MARDEFRIRKFVYEFTFGDEIRIRNSYPNPIRHMNSTKFVNFVYEFQLGRNSYGRIEIRIDEFRIDEIRIEMNGSQFVLEFEIRIRIQRI